MTCDNRLQPLNDDFEAVREDERRRLARDLHDGTAQLIVLMQLKIGQLRRLAPEGSEELIENLDEALAEVRQQVRGYL